MSLGYDDYMFRCLGVDVPESQEFLILIDDITGYLTSNNAAKKTFLSYAYLSKF